MPLHCVWFENKKITFKNRNPANLMPMNQKTNIPYRVHSLNDIFFVVLLEICVCFENQILGNSVENWISTLKRATMNIFRHNWLATTMTSGADQHCRIQGPATTSFTKISALKSIKIPILERKMNILMICLSSVWVLLIVPSTWCFQLFHH